MADGTQVGSAADIMLTDDLATRNGGAYTGQKVQVVKIGYGADADIKEVNATTQLLPVNISGSGGATAQTTQTLSAAGAATLAGATSGTTAYVLDVSSAGNASFHLLTVAFVGTVVFEQSFDSAGSNGTWAPVPMIPEDVTGPPVNTLAINTAVAYIKQFTGSMFGPKLFRVRCSVFTSGTLTVLGSAGPGWYEGQPALAPSTNVIGAVSMAAATTYAVTTVNSNATANTNSVSLAADSTRKGLIIWNRGTVPLTVGFGTATSATVYSVIIPAAQGYEVPPQFAPSAINTQASVVSSPIQFTAAI